MKPVMKKDGNSEDICLGEKEKKRFESDYRERVGLSSKQARTLFLKREQPCHCHCQNHLSYLLRT